MGDGAGDSQNKARVLDLLLLESEYKIIATANAILAASIFYT